jgi:TyrR family helix-turn-helix protein
LNKYSDLTLTCIQCGKEFIFSEDEQEFYKSKGYTTPHHCKTCRSSRRQQTAVCSKCGSQFVDGAPVFCAACQVNLRLEYEQKIQVIQNKIDSSQTEAASAADARAAAVEAEKNRLLEEAGANLASLTSEKEQMAEILKQKELLVSSLEKQILEKAFKQNLTTRQIAKMLKVDHSTIVRKAAKYGITNVK